jgi:hypothetical protein
MLGQCLGTPDGRRNVESNKPWRQKSLERNTSPRAPSILRGRQSAAQDHLRCDTAHLPDYMLHFLHNLLTATERKHGPALATRRKHRLPEEAQVLMHCPNHNTPKHTIIYHSTWLDPTKHGTTGI